MLNKTTANVEAWILIKIPIITKKTITKAIHTSGNADGIEQTINDALKARGITLQEFIDQRRAKEQAIFKSVMQTPAGQKAYRQMYNIPDDVDLSAYEGNGFLQEISESVLKNVSKTCIETTPMYCVHKQILQKIREVEKCLKK